MSKQVGVLVVILLFLNLPMVSALEISNIRVQDLRDDSAVIAWETDEPADSFVSYGEEQESLNTIGDASQVTSHQVPLTDLKSETAYLYNVKSGSQVDDNAGSLYSFTTPAPDTTAPELAVELPERVPGNSIDLAGFTEVGAEVRLLVNGIVAGTTIASQQEELQADLPAGKFLFTGVALAANKANTITLEARDADGNMQKVEGSVFSDTSRPVIDLKNIPTITDARSFKLAAGISEEAEYEIFVNNKSVAKGSGVSITETITFQEGENELRITAKDAAGWETVISMMITSDTQAPQIKNFNVEKGTEFYQGRAVSSLHGETEPGSEVYLFVYRQTGTEYQPEFDKAWEKVTAGANGEFTFSEINFESQPFDQINLEPKLVPSGLQEQTIFPIQQVAAQQQFTYHVYLIAVDKSGKSGFAKTTLSLKSCFGEGDFAVISLAQFQAPFRLDPGLLDEGREVATAVFNLSYRGQGVAGRDVSTGAIIPGQEAFEISNVQFEKACTQGMMKDESFKLGCTILSPQPRRPLPNADKTSWYITYNLNSAEKLSEGSTDYWNEFKKRQVIFPLKIKITYRERLSDGKFGETKTDNACYDLSYFVDVPVDSKNMLPDFLVEEGVEAIKWTVDKIDVVLPYLEKAILVTGVGCIASFLSRLTVRVSRVFVSKLETYFSRNSPEGEKCPGNQDQLLMESDIDHWKEIESLFGPENQPRAEKDKDWADKERSLDKLCPQTTALWKAEAALDQAYKWTCDRVLCRAVPAAWTEDRKEDQIKTVILEQQQCTATSRGIPLIPVENCQNLVVQDVGVKVSPKALALKKEGSFPCYRNPVNNQLYYISEAARDTDEGKVVELDWLAPHGALSIQEALQAESKPLIAYKPQNSKDLIVGVDQACKFVCKNARKPGYVADTSDRKNGKGDANGCYTEKIDPTDNTIKLYGTNGEPLKGENTYAAGYTSDCFVTKPGEASVTRAGDTCSNTDDCKSSLLRCLDAKCVLISPQTAPTTPAQTTGISGTETGLSQCVCTGEEAKESAYGARVGAKAEGDLVEEWDYRQAVINKHNPFAGTRYPDVRYYGNRDRSGAFGANYLTDYLKADGEEEVHQVNPHTQHVGAFQAVCLSGIRARLLQLKSILVGLQNCIQEAKVTGLHDAGVCKTLFTQHMCGLLYKAIAYFFTSCTPYNFADATKGGAFEDVEAVVSAGVSSVSEATSSSIQDIQDDYGNAQLNQYFAGGTKGFAQSMCLAAFGYDWPLGADFILDAAYAFPFASTVHVIPAEREFSSYNPASGNAVYNYNIGALVLPGCRIRNYDVYLKCIGQEDLDRPGIQCGSQGCDCLHATQASALEGEKIKQLDGGRGFDLKSGSFVEVPIPAPQKVDSGYRYDHVVVDLKIDPNEDPSKCFDEGYRDGKFYYPIIDVSPPGVGVCQVQPTTGKYYCPEIVKLFGGGSGAYLADPYISCYDKNTQSFVSCDTPNLFVKGDQIRIKTNTFTDGGKYCLRTTVSGLQDNPVPDLPRELPQGIPGPYNPEINVGTVTEAMFSGTGGFVVLANSKQLGCSEPQFGPIPQNLPTQQFAFGYSNTGNGYIVTVQAGVTITNTNQGYGLSGSTLTRDGNTVLSSAEILGAQFNLNGMVVQNLVGSPQGNSGQCVYQTQAAAGSTFQQKSKVVTITSELLLPDAAGSCYNAQYLVKPPAYGKPSFSQRITLQLEPIVSQVVSKMHQEFSRGNCQNVMQNAQSILNRRIADGDDVNALYYMVACLINTGKENWKQAYETDVCRYMGIFANRYYPGLEFEAPRYPDEVKSSAEYQKVQAYFAEINKELSCTGVAFPEFSGEYQSPAVPRPQPVPQPAPQPATPEEPRVIDIDAITSGDTITLQSAHGTYCSAWQTEGTSNHPVICTRPVASGAASWEKFIIELADGGSGSIEDGDTITLKSAHRTYCSSWANSEDNFVGCTRPISEGFDSWEEFVIEKADGSGAIENEDAITLKSAHNTYCSSWAGVLQDGVDYHQMICTRPVSSGADAWEKFIIGSG